MPGLDLGGLHIPLNPDGFASMILANVGVPPLQDFLGVLDGQGRFTADLAPTAPQLAPFAGETMTFAFILVAPIDFASNAIDVDIEP